MNDDNDIGSVPDIGCFISGMYLDGAAWCSIRNSLIEPKDGIQFYEMPAVSYLLSVIPYIKFFSR